jgi:hypothetical protein
LAGWKFLVEKCHQRSFGRGLLVRGLTLNPCEGSLQKHVLPGGFAHPYSRLMQKLTEMTGCRLNILNQLIIVQVIHDSSPARQHVSLLAF